VGRGRRSLTARAKVERLLPRDFFDRPATEVAPALLGCVLEHETADGLVAVQLTEVEAYAGAADPASHAYRGLTGRNAVMFGPPGHAYVYFTYGMHFCVNVVCRPAGIAEAVLLRAGRIVAGEPLAQRRRAPRAPEPGQADAAGTAGVRDLAAAPEPGQADAPRALPVRDLARGPGRLCRALAITRSQDGADLCLPSSPLRLRPPAGGSSAGAIDGIPGDGTDRMPGDGTPGDGTPGDGPPSIAVGPRVGISVAADIPWRFWVAGDPTVSAYRLAKPRRR
jgi:DNA-3-methyladenine glycosylase